MTLNLFDMSSREDVELKKERDGTIKSFEISVAESILKDKQGKFSNLKYWVLPDNSNYVFKSGSLVEKKKVKTE